jgi:hypothetical protein
MRGHSSRRQVAMVAPTAYTQSTKCPTGTLVGSSDGATIIVAAKCKRWSCNECGPRKARLLAKRIRSTPARRFITLTAQPIRGESPQETLDRLSRGWRLIWKRLKREQGEKARGYVRIVELTKAGRPHLHIAVDCAYVRQSRLSYFAREVGIGSVVDIRAIKTERGLARYLAKYLTKAHETLKNRRKWSASYRYLPPADREPLEAGELPLSWKWVKGDEDHVTATYLTSGYEPSPHSSFLVLVPASYAPG